MLCKIKHILLNINKENTGKHLILIFEINVDFSIKYPKHDLKNLAYDKFINFFLLLMLKI